MLTSMNLSRSHESSVEPRVVVSNNAKTVKFFDIALRTGMYADDYESRLLDIGQLRLDVPVNHCAYPPSREHATGINCTDGPCLHPDSLHLSRRTDTALRR